MYSVVQEKDNYPESDRDMAHPFYDNGKLSWVNLRWIRDTTNVMKKAPWRTAEKIAQYNAQKGDSSSGANTSGITNEDIKKIVEYAYSKIGCEYDQNRRNQKGVYDCSSFVYRAYYEGAGIDLADYGGGGSPSAPATTTNKLVSAGTEVPIDPSKPLSAQVQAGDFILNSSLGHVVLCVGNGKIIEAKGEKYGVVLDDVDKRYKTSSISTVRRVLN